CHVEAGPPLAAATARRLACDGRLRLIAEGPDGSTIGVGRATRAIPASLRRALRARDGACVFPGCTSRRVDAHHRRHWAHGGPTDLGKLVELCRHHHRLIHEGGYQVAFDGLSATVTDPTGRDLTKLARSAPATGPPIAEQHAAHDLMIDAMTAAAR